MAQIPNINPYEILGVKHDASEQEIKQAYLKLARRFHPDKAAMDKKQKYQEFFKLVSQAYNLVKNAKRRAEYDKTILLLKQMSGDHFTLSKQSEDYLKNQTSQPTNADIKKFKEEWEELNQKRHFAESQQNDKLDEKMLKSKLEKMESERQRQNAEKPAKLFDDGKLDLNKFNQVFDTTYNPANAITEYHGKPMAFNAHSQGTEFTPLDQLDDLTDETPTEGNGFYSSIDYALKPQVMQELPPKPETFVPQSGINVSVNELPQRGNPFPVAKQQTNLTKAEEIQNRMKEYELDTRRLADRTSNEFKPNFQGIDEDDTIVRNNKMPNQQMTNTNYLTDGSEHQELINEFAQAKISDTTESKVYVQQTLVPPVQATAQQPTLDNDNGEELVDNMTNDEKEFLREQLKLKRQLDRKKMSNFRPRRIDEFLQPSQPQEPISILHANLSPQNVNTRYQQMVRENHQPLYTNPLPPQNVNIRYQQMVRESHQPLYTNPLPRQNVNDRYQQMLQERQMFDQQHKK